MNGALERFQELAERALNGDREAEKDFFEEASHLFPLDFDDAKVSQQGDVSSKERSERIESALALIRQTLTTGG